MTTLPLLSLILCSRNDTYLGNSRWRLETTLNYVGEQVAALGRERDVEVLVADWGSDVPLRDVVALGPAAAEIVRFLTVPPALSRQLQRDSPFPEVLALNAAARRARGRYIGRIDQDTLVGTRFLRWLFDAAAGTPGAGVPEGMTLETTLLFANRRSIPYRVAVQCPPLPIVRRFLRWFGRRLRIETGQAFYRIDVGIWLLHRDLWQASGGYDERMIYMNDMEIEMATRLMARYPMVDLGKLVDFDFYHLDHYHPRGSRSSSTHRRVNELDPDARPTTLNPNGDGWGLATYPIDIVQAPPERQRALAGASSDTLLAFPAFAAVVALAGARIAIDSLVYPFVPKWRRRAAVAWQAVRGQSPARWPAVLRRLWLERPSARAR